MADPSWSKHVADILRRNGIRLFATVPDYIVSHVLEHLWADRTCRVVTACREEEGLGEEWKEWGSGFIDEVFGQISESPVVGRAGGLLTDWLFEAGFGREIGSYAWRNMKQDAQAAFGGQPDYDGGFRGLMPLFDGLDRAAKRPKRREP